MIMKKKYNYIIIYNYKKIAIRFSDTLSILLKAHIRVSCTQMFEFIENTQQ